MSKQKRLLLAVLFIFLCLHVSSVGSAVIDDPNQKESQCHVLLDETRPTPQSEKPKLTNSKSPMTPAQFVSLIENETTLFQLIKLGVIFKLHSEEDQATIFRSLMEQGREIPLALLVGLLTGEAQANALKFMAKEMPQYMFTPLVKAKELTSAEKYDLLEQAISNSSYGQLATLYASILYHLRPIAVRHSSPSIRTLAFAMRMVARLIPPIKKRMSKSPLDKFSFLSDEQKAHLFRLSLQHDPLSLMMALTNAQILVDTPLNAASEPSDLRRTIQVFSERFPELFPKEWVAISTDHISQREVSLGLIRELYRLSGEDSPWIIPANALDTVCRSGGLNYARMSGVTYSQEGLTRLYEVILDTQTQLKTPAYAGVHIEDALLKQKKLAALNGLFLNLKNLLFLRGFNQEIWNGIRAEFSLDTAGITSANVDSLTLETQKKVSIALNDVLQKNSNDHGSALTLEQYQSLEGKWIETDTVLTLMARYNATRAWRPEIKVLMKLLKAEAEGTFLQLKKEGDPQDESDQEKARAQTAILDTPQKQDAWWRPWHKAALFEPSNSKPSTVDTEKDASTLSSVKQDIATSILPAFADAQLLSNAQDVYRFALSSKESVDEVLTALHSHGYQDRSIARVLVETAIDNQTSAEEIQKTLGFVKALSRRDPSLNTQLATSLSTVFNKLKPLSTKQADQKKEIIVTSTSHSLRIGLSLGSLVDAGSCMNPVTGVRADVIPSLATDANIQAIFSTALNPNDFVLQSDFIKVVRWLSDQKPVHISFDSDKSIYRFATESGDTVTTNAINRFYRRYQLKVGTGKGHIPVIRTERAFSQEHHATAIMIKQTKSIKEEMAHEMGGKVDVPMTMEATRNLPGGTYSDTVHMKTGNGLKKSTYEIPSPLF